MGKIERMLAKETQGKFLSFSTLIFHFLPFLNFFFYFEGDACIPTDVAERIASDVNHLLFSVSKMKVLHLKQVYSF